MVAFSPLDWLYNGVTLLIELLEWVAHFRSRWNWTGNNRLRLSSPAPRRNYHPLNNTCYLRLPNAPWVCSPVPFDKGSLTVKCVKYYNSLFALSV